MSGSYSASNRVRLGERGTSPTAARSCPSPACTDDGARGDSARWPSRWSFRPRRCREVSRPWLLRQRIEIRIV